MVHYYVFADVLKKKKEKLKSLPEKITNFSENVKKLEKEIKELRDTLQKKEEEWKRLSDTLSNLNSVKKELEEEIENSKVIDEIVVEEKYVLQNGLVDLNRDILMRLIKIIGDVYFNELGVRNVIF
jgi:chromosome segregation ATPase